MARRDLLGFMMGGLAMGRGVGEWRTFEKKTKQTRWREINDLGPKSMES